MTVLMVPQSSPFIAYDRLPSYKRNRIDIIASETRYPLGHQCRRRNFMKAYTLLRHKKHSGRRGTVGWRGIVARIELSNPDDYEVGRLLGSYGYMNITSYASPQSGGLAAGALENSGAGMSFKDIGKLSGQEVGEGNVQIRLYSGRVSRGPRMGTRVIFKDVPEDEMCPNLQILLGGFQTSTGEQWLVFRDDGKSTAANYATIAREATTEGRAVGEWEFWDRFNRDLPIKRRRVFIIKLLRGAFNGLSYMHTHNRLHQSLGPASVVLNILEEGAVSYLVPRLRDLAFAVDISDQAIFGSRDLPLDTASEALSEGLWRRAAKSGASTPLEKKAFGIADDIYAAGLLLAYMAFIPFCEAGSIDGPSLQRLLESTFQLDMEAIREYCKADDRWTEGVNFLDLGDGAGWELLQAMLNPNYRLRPTAKAVLDHRFMTGAVL